MPAPVVVGISQPVEEAQQHAARWAAVRDRIERAGARAEPVPVPGWTAAQLDQLHALLLVGGGGYATAAASDRLSDVEPERYRSERDLCFESRRRQLPLLGICRGMQVIAEAHAGGRVAALPAEQVEQHVQAGAPQCPCHAIEIERSSWLAGALGRSSAQVNSLHRQAVVAVGADLVVSARAPDGVVEAIEGRGRSLVVGVQFHPELLSEEWAALFEAFVTAARAGGR